MQKIKRHPGRAFPLGASAAFFGINFALSAPGAANVTVICDDDKTKGTELPMHRAGVDVFAVAASGLNPDTLTYTFLVDGRETKDPYARKTLGSRLSCLDTAPTDHEVNGPGLLKNELVLYELHIKGFAGSFEKAIGKIPHLLALGVNGLMLMPVYEFQGDYWGYVPGSLLAPKESYGETPGEQCAALRNLIAACHESGMEVYLDLSMAGIEEGILKEAVSHYASCYGADGFKVSKEVKLDQPHLKNCKLFYDYDMGFTNTARRFLKGESGLVYSLATAMEWGGDQIHCVACHDGLTLRDWAGDGKTAKNALTLAILGRGIPLIAMGDEMGRSQNGQDNAHDLDDESLWLDWGLLHTNSGLFEYARQLIALRKERPCLRSNCAGGDFPPVSCHGPIPWQGDFFGNTLCMLYQGPEEAVYVMFNQSCEPKSFLLPEGFGWELYMQTGEDALHPPLMYLSSFSSAVLLGRR